MRLCSYVVRRDHGFAPNPYWGYCTVACCKPDIRKSAETDDWIVGTSSKTEHKTGTHLVFVMRISERPLTFDEYSTDLRFRLKVPRHGLIEQRGDNIYYRDENGAFHQRVPSYHSMGWKPGEEWQEHEDKKQWDLSGKNVLVAGPEDFWYFGRSLEIPQRFLWVIWGRQGHSYKFPQNKAKELIEWIRGIKPGIHGDPFDLHARRVLEADLWK